MSDQEFNLPDDSKPTTPPIPPAADDRDPVRSAFEPQIKNQPTAPEQPAGSGGFFQNLFNTVREVFQSNVDQKTDSLASSSQDLERPKDFGDEAGQPDAAYEANFPFLEEEDLAAGPPEIPGGESTLKDSADSFSPVDGPPPSAGLSGLPDGGAHPSVAAGEISLPDEELDLTPFLPEATDPSSQTAVNPRPDDEEPSSQQDPHTLSTRELTAASQPDQSASPPPPGSRQRQGATQQGPVSFLDGWDASDSAISNAASEEELDDLRAALLDEDSTLDDGYEVPSGLSSSKEKQDSGDEPDFTFATAVTRPIKPLDFPFENPQSGSTPNVFIFEKEDGVGEEPFPASQSESAPDVPVAPFTQLPGTHPGLDGFPPITEPHQMKTSPLENRLQRGGISPKTQAELSEASPDLAAAMDTSELFTQFAVEEQDPIQQESEEPDQAESTPGNIFGTLAGWSLREKLLVIVAVLFGFLIVATTAMIASNAILRPLIRSFQLPDSAQNAPAAPAVDSSIYPTSLKLPGGWIFNLQESTIQDGNWEPAAAEYLSGATLRRVVALPWSKQAEAVISTFEKGDELLLFMNNNDVIGYNVEEVKQVPQEDTTILAGTRPSLVVILYNPGAASRWVVFCKP